MGRLENWAAWRAGRGWALAITATALAGSIASCTKGEEQAKGASGGANRAGTIVQAVGGDFPKGLALAGSPETTEAVLESAGFNTIGPCAYGREDGAVVAIAVSDATPCEPGRPAYVTRYTRRMSREQSDGEIARLNKRFGGACEPTAVECEWVNPKGSSGVDKVVLDRRMGERVTTSIYSNPPPAAPQSAWPPAAQAYPDLAPAGVILGVGLSDARTALVAAGLKEVASCRFGMTMGRQRRQVILVAGNPAAGRTTACEDQAPVRQIESTLQNDQGSPEVIAGLNKAIGAPAACLYERPQDARCAWNTPASYPLAQAIFVTTGPQGTVLSITAVDDLKRPNTAPAEYPPAFNPLAGVGEVSPTRPGGVGLGDSLATVRDGLTEAGFKLSQASLHGADASCIWVYNRPYEIEINVDVLASTPNGSALQGAPQSACQGDGVIRRLLFRKLDKRPSAFAKAPTATDAMAAWINEIQSPPSQSRLCPVSADPTFAMCSWRDLPGQTGSSHVTLSFRTTPHDKRNLVSVALETAGR